MSTTPVYIIEDQDVITQRLIDYFRDVQSVITNFNEGAEARNLLESIGMSVHDQRYLIDYLFNMGYVATAEGDWLDGIGLLVNCNRKQAVQSTGTITISTPTTKIEDILISDGTLLLCSSDDSLFFETVGDITLTAGSPSVNNNGIASIGGVNGNVVAGEIDTFDTPIEDLTVTNNAPFIDGTDVEDDTDFRSRILEAGKGNITGSITWYQVEAAKIDGVHDVGVINKPLIPGYDLEILVNGTTKPTPSNVVSAVNSLFGQEDHKIGGVNVLVTSPIFITQDVNVGVLLKDGYSWDEVSATLTSDIMCYFNGGITSYGTPGGAGDYIGLNEGEGITLTVLQMIIVNSLGTSFLDYTITSPATNISIAVDHAVMLGNINLTQTTSWSEYGSNWLWTRN